MKFEAISLLLFLITGVQEPDIKTIRAMYVQAAEQREAAERLLDLLKHNKNPLYTGYAGATNMIMAKHALNPVKKMAYFRKGRTMLQKSIGKDPENAELRFIRYSIQVSAPGILDYNDDVSADYAFLIQSLRANAFPDKDFRTTVVRFLLSQNPAPEEKTFLQKLL